MNLNEVLADIWRELVSIKNNRQHPFRFGTLGTLNEDNVNMRMVVIREIIEAEKEIWFYTDYRTPKVSEIKNNSKITWLFYHPEKQIQIRLKGTAEIFHNEKINQEVWNNLPDYGKSDYLTKESPGAKKENETISTLEIDNATNFCIIKTTIYKIDWLKLDRKGHRRAAFEFVDNQWFSKWLIP